jgi:hypothetical protein
MGGFRADDRVRDEEPGEGCVRLCRIKIDRPRREAGDNHIRPKIHVSAEGNPLDHDLGDPVIVGNPGPHKDRVRLCHLQIRWRIEDHDSRAHIVDEDHPEGAGHPANRAISIDIPSNR